MSDDEDELWRELRITNYRIAGLEGILSSMAIELEELRVKAGKEPRGDPLRALRLLGNRDLLEKWDDAAQRGELDP